MGGGFRWNDWNLEHATKHGCTVPEIEMVIGRELRYGRAKKIGDGKWGVQGRGTGSRMIECVFVYDLRRDEEVEEHAKSTIYVIHAMPLTLRRRRRGKRGR